MLHFEELYPDIYLLKVPFSGLWTGVVLIRGDENCLIDSGAKDTDVDQYLLPALEELGMDLQAIKWLLNTHSHGDHIGGHARIRNLTNLKVAAPVVNTGMQQISHRMFSITRLVSMAKRCTQMEFKLNSSFIAAPYATNISG